jgi:amidase
VSAFPEYGNYDGLGLAELVRTGQIAPAELLDEAIARVEAANPRINAVVRTMYDQARETVRRGLGNGPFAGVPFLIKDLLADYAGVPTGSGTKLLQNIPAPRDAEIVRRYKAAGLVIFGKTNTPEFGLVPYTEPAVSHPSRRAVMAVARFVYQLPAAACSA